MKVKIIFMALILFSFIACGDEKENKEETNTEKVEKEVKFDKLIKFSLNIHKSDTPLEIKRISEDNKNLEITNNDKIVMFNFFTTWCPPCIAEIPYLNNLAQKYGENIRIIGVLLEEKTPEEIDKFISENNINYEIATGENAFTFLKILGEINGIPYIALYDSEGKNINNYLGAVYQEMIDIDIQKVIK